MRCAVLFVSSFLSCFSFVCACVVLYVCRVVCVCAVCVCIFFRLQNPLLHVYVCMFLSSVIYIGSPPPSLSLCVCVCFLLLLLLLLLHHLLLFFLFFFDFVFFFSFFFFFCVCLNLLSIIARFFGQRGERVSAGRSSGSVLHREGVRWAPTLMAAEQYTPIYSDRSTTTNVMDFRNLQPKSNQELLGPSQNRPGQARFKPKYTHTQQRDRKQTVWAKPAGTLLPSSTHFFHSLTASCWHRYTCSPGCWRTAESTASRSPALPRCLRHVPLPRR
jgi:hypothetical protein